MGKSGDDSKASSLIKEATNVMTGKLKWLSLSDEKGIKHTGDKKSDGKQHLSANAKEVRIKIITHFFVLQTLLLKNKLTKYSINSTKKRFITIKTLITLNHT